MSIKTFILAGIAIVMSACQSTPQSITPAAQYFFDDEFKGYEKEHIETEAELFHLDKEALKFIRSNINQHDSRSKQILTLTTGLFENTKLNVSYQSDANTTANETFLNQSANCLSLSIMMYAIAKKAGFSAHFQYVDIPDYWSERRGFSLISNHINVKIVSQDNSLVWGIAPRGYEVDFGGQASNKEYAKRAVSKEAVVAMFYNNKGVDAMVSENFPLAYAYFKQALNLSPENASFWVNLGILYRLKGLIQQAEMMYETALKIEPEHVNAIGNLAYLYSQTKDHNKAIIYKKKLEAKRNHSPQYHVFMGDRSLSERDFAKALQHYRKALKLDAKTEEVFFGLAKTYFSMDNFHRSRHYMRLARNYSGTEEDKQRYSGKLKLLSKL